MNHLLAICRDRIHAETIYSRLEQEEIPKPQITILGRGYKTADEYGLIDPIETGRRQALLMAVWLVPFGVVSGVTFSLITNLQTFAWAGQVGNWIIAGLLGGISGAMGSFFVGGGAGVAFGSGDALPYRNRLAEGKYIIAVQGSEELLRRARQIIQPLEPERIQSYIDVSSR